MVKTCAYAGGGIYQMATLRYRARKKNDASEYDIIHFETNSEIVMRPNGTTVESAIQGLAEHRDRTDNPHSVTASQVGAVPTGRTIAGHSLANDLSRRDLAYLGDAVVNSVADDTTSNWANIGPGYSFYSDSTTLTDKPSSWGILINFPYGSDIFQIWSCQNTGPIYWRNGNGAGWGRTWTKVIDADTLNKTTNDPGAGSYLSTDSLCIVYES